MPTRYNKYWYPLVLTMIKRYPKLKDDDSLQAVIYARAVEVTLKELKDTEDFESKLKAYNMVLFNATCSMDAAAGKLYVSRRTIQRWINDFVYKVGEHAGFGKPD